MIELIDVDVHYGRLKALDAVTCTIVGGAVGLLGPNGAGKSTLLKTLLGFNRASRGSVKLFGVPMPQYALDARQQLGYMPEREVVSPKISAVSFLTYCGQLFGMSHVDARERCHELLNYVGLGESRYRKMETYSTGMLQRVKLAQALIHDPQLLLLDEPTNGLDPDGRVEMLDLIREVAVQRDVTVLLSTHLLPDVQHVCDQVLIIHSGRIVQEGRISDLTTLQERQFELRVRDNKNRFIEALSAAAIAYEELKNGDLLLSMPAGVEPRRLFELAADCDTQVRHFVQARQSLADVFMHAIGSE